MCAATANSPFPGTLPDWTRHLASLGIGVVASCVIFYGLSRVQKTADAEPPPPLDDLREIAMPFEPPPPPVVRQTEVPPIASNNLIVIEAGRSESVVKLPALPEIVPESVPRVLGVPRIDFSAKEFKPSEVDSEFESRRVYDRREVDQPCVPLVKVRPEFTQFMLRAADRPQVVYLFIVNRDGSVEGLRLLQSSGNTHLDKACAQALVDWKFAPAIRRGRKVRQWVQQAISFKIEAGSRFETN